MAKPFSYDLGVFDPIFPGITLHFPNEAIWEHTSAAAAMIYSFAALDTLSRDPKLTEGDITPALLVGRLLENPDRGFTLSAEDKDQLGQSLIAGAADDAVGYLAAGSAHEHERRHFHDWLLSPYTAAINTIRVEVSLNYARLRPFIYGTGTTVVPVPLPRWLRKTASEQAELIQMWQGLLGETIHVRLPDLSAPGVLPAIEAIERRYGSIGGLFQPLGGLPGLNAATVFEASAILIQIQAIHDIWGETAGTRFAVEMTNPANQTPYAYVIAPMTCWLKPGEAFENDILLAFVTWSLLGCSNADRENANPLVRILHVYHYLEKHGFPLLGTPAQAIFTALDQECGVVPYQELLTQSVQLNDAILNSLMSDISAPNISNFELGIVQTYGVLHDCHKYMVGHFLKDPDGYAKPVDYLDRTLGLWPEPPIRWSFGRPFRRIKREELSKYQGVVLFDEHADQDEVFLRQGITGRDEPTPMKVDLKIADNWQFACTLADSLFAEFNRDQPEIELHRDQLKKRGVYLMEVLT
jgi:hypothetical protein